MTRNPHKRSGKQKLLLIVFGLVCGLLMSEILLRVVGYSAPLFYAPDYYRGVVLRPNVAGTYQREGRNYVSINSAGLRDREHSIAKPANAIRIALLGDSFCEAMQLPLEQTFWWLLQQKLESCGRFAGRQVEVINFGVSGYGTAQELITLRQQVWQYSPDIVILVVTTNNDISDNVRALKKTNQIPYFYYRDNQLIEDDSFRNTPAFRWRAFTSIGVWFRDHLRTVQLGYEVQLLIKTKLDERRTRRQTPAPAPASEQATKQPAAVITVENMIYLPPRDAVWNEAWHVTEGLIREIHQEVNEKGAGFFLVIGSNPIQVHPDRAVRESFRSNIGVDDLFYPNLRLEQLALTDDIPVIDLAPEMQKFADEQHVFLHGFGKEIGNGHWNPAGHRLAAEIMAQKLCSEYFASAK